MNLDKLDHRPELDHRPKLDHRPEFDHRSEFDHQSEFDHRSKLDHRSELDHRPKLVLVGPMGSGKTTVARILGRRWNVATRDTDHDIERLAGKTVQDIFVDDGEATFRALEAAAVATALAEHEGVLSLGGGAVLDPATQERLSGHTVVFLRVGLADAVKRVGLGESRPVLNQAVGGVRSRIKSLLDERTPIYESVATITVDTDRRTPDDVADEIIARLEESR